MTFDPGDVVLLPFPFTDLPVLKKRPVLVLSSSKYNRSSSDLIVCGITSVLTPRPHAVPLVPSDMDRGTLPVESRIRPDKVFTLRKALAIKTLGSVRDNVLHRVRRELLGVLGWRA